MRYVKNSDGVQHPETRFFEITLADFVANDNLVEIELPSGSMLSSGTIYRDTAFNSSGTDTIRVGDSGAANRYVPPTDLKTNGPANFAFVAAGPLSGYLVGSADNGKLRIERQAENPNATAGSVLVFVQYVRLGRACHTQG